MAHPADELPDLSFDQLIELERRAAARDAGDGGVHGDDDDRYGGGEDDDATIVLPWWQHPMNVVTMVVTAAPLAAMIGWMVGDGRSRPQHGEVDTGFLHDMRVHHEQAVFMSFVYRALPDTDPGLDVIAGSIIVGQSQDIGRMVQMLRSFGEPEAADVSAPVMGWMGMSTAPDQMPGLASDADIERLATSSGADADALFVELMIAHHTGGIHMAEFAAQHAENAEVRAMAAAMQQGQQGEIAELRRELD